MLRLAGVIVTIALIDSLNPSTIGPAIYFASGQRARRSVLEFTVAVLITHLAGGALLMIGPGPLLLWLVRGLGPTVKHLAELSLGVGIVLAAGLTWHHRARLSRKELPDPNRRRRSALILGASIIIVELPTALPYFAAIAAILESGTALSGRLAALVLYNVCFVLPLIAILATLVTTGDRAQRILETGRTQLQTRWPAALAGLLLTGGSVVIALASIGLVSR
jgi:cytochrome c biogenesis protein CcdA